jgi:hypothetical protein
LPVFAATSFVAVLLGAVVCARSGVPIGLWGRNLAAWAAGGVAAAGLARFAGVWMLRVVAAATPLLLAATMMGEGQDHVHRWLDLGPVNVNAAMATLPAFIVAVTVLADRAAWWWITALLCLGVLVVQPDASQATALAVAMCIVLPGVRKGAARTRWMVALSAIALAALSWTRPDRLAPVAEVENVLRLAEAVSPLLMALSVVALFAFAATPLITAFIGSGGPVRLAAVGLSALFAAWSLARVFGAYPVPLVGVGLSPILGAWLGVGLLAGLAAPRRRG